MSQEEAGETGGAEQKPKFEAKPITLKIKDQVREAGGSAGTERRLAARGGAATQARGLPPSPPPPRLCSTATLHHVLRTRGAAVDARRRRPPAVRGAATEEHSALLCRCLSPFSSTLQDGGEIIMKVKTNTKFEKVSTQAGQLVCPLRSPHASLSLPPSLPPKVFKAYCAKKAVSEDGVRFLFDGSRLARTQTCVQPRREARTGN